MPIEVTAEGLNKLSSLPKSVPVSQQQVKVSAAEPVKTRQELPSSVPLLSSPDKEAVAEDKSVMDIEQKVENLNSHIQNLQRDLHFSVDAESGRTVIRVIDRETQETIRTIPPEDISVMARSLERHAGILFNTSV